MLTVDALTGGAMPVAASVRGQMRAQAVGALVMVRSEQRRAANLNRVENLPVMLRQPIGSRITGQAGAQDIGQKQRWGA